MPNPVKAAFLDQLSKRFGPPKKLERSESLYEIGDNHVRLYFRYSKRHPRGQTFFGLRKIDLQALEGHQSLLCFTWDGQREPLFVPFEQFSEILSGLTPASDGQIKAQVYEQDEATELYLAKAGRFNVDSFIGWDVIESAVRSSTQQQPDLSHSQVQTLLGGIGHSRGFDVWIPPYDRAKLDWNLTSPFRPTLALPSALASISEIAQEIDVIWLARGAGSPVALYEVEHSTPIYSGLLRFNDVRLALPDSILKFGIVSNDDRRALFVRQLERPTFKASGLRDNCTFFEYNNVYGWHQRIIKGAKSHG